MYNEDRGSLKGVFIKILLVVVILFILMTLFPTKGFLTNYVNSKLKTNNDNFNNNLLSMATVASGYYTGSRLPKNTGDKVSMTLGEMLDKKMLVNFTDENNKVCNNKKSYVEITKNQEDYTMKVNLSCPNKEDYILLHMGLNDTSFPSTSTERCEFVKNLDNTVTYSNWSNWSTKKVSNTDTRQVQTKVNKVKTGTKQVSKQIINKQEPTKYIINGNKTIYICSSNYDNAGRYNTYTQCVKKSAIYVNEPVYSNITYYRYRTKSLSSNQIDTKWANCNDESLLNQGYTLTGKKDKRG